MIVLPYNVNLFLSISEIIRRSQIQNGLKINMKLWIVLEILAEIVLIGSSARWPSGLMCFSAVLDLKVVGLNPGPQTNPEIKKKPEK